MTTLINKDYCNKDTCFALRKLGYDAPQRLIPDYFGVFSEPQYDEEIHLYDAQKWLREEKRICVEVDCYADGYEWKLCNAYHKNWYSGGIIIYNTAIEAMLNDCGKYDSYEEALLEGIKTAIKILKDEKVNYGRFRNI